MYPQDSMPSAVLVHEKDQISGGVQAFRQTRGKKVKKRRKRMSRRRRRHRIFQEQGGQTQRLRAQLGAHRRLRGGAVVALVEEQVSATM